jgi:ribosomal protein S27E
MPEAYCFKCKAKKEIVDAVEEVMKNGRRAIKGKCQTCGAVMFKFVGGKAAASPTPAATPAKPESTT